MAVGVVALVSAVNQGDLMRTYTFKSLLSLAMTLAFAAAAAAPPANEREWMLTVTTISRGEPRLQYAWFPTLDRCEEARKAVLKLIGPRTPDLDADPQGKCERVKA